VFKTTGTFAPTSLTYHRMEITLTISFAGTPGEVPRSGS
jgi:hypothetical protein